MTMTIKRGALIALSLLFSGASVLAQTKQTSTVEVGPSDVTDGSFKAGEYNGFQNSGANGIGNVDLRGGNAGYNSENTLRWRVRGNDLGLETRGLTADVSQQGRFHLSFGYDELRRNRSDTYQTPYTGTGTNVLTLPTGWLVPTVAGSSGSNSAVNTTSARGLVPTIGGSAYINTATNSSTMGGLLVPTSSQLSLVNAAAAADVPMFQTLDLYTKRRTFTGAFTYNFDPQWSIDASVSPQHKEGMKPMGTVSRNTGGDMSTIIPDLIDQDHNQVNANVTYKGQKAFAQAAYYGSIFRNNVPFMSWQNWATPAGTANVISSAPNNNFNQVNATGGVNFTQTTKLVVNGSYGRATQNDAFVTDPTDRVVPVSSLNGLVVTSAFNAKLSGHPTKKVSLSAGYRFDNRDNQTGVHIFQYSDANETPTANAAFAAGPNNPLGAVLAQNANANRPYNRRMNQVNLDSDYNVAPHQWIKAGYDFERIDRSCTDTWIDCVDADRTNEHTARADWRASVSGSVTARVGYAYASRRAPNYNENAFLALVPYANVIPAGATASAYSFMLANGWTGYGPTAGYAPTTGNMNLFFPSNNALANSMYANNNRISELPGMRRFYVADRDRNRLRSSLSWQPTDEFSIDTGVNVTNDNYPNSIYGLQSAKGWAGDLDAAYQIGAGLTASVFYTFEDQRSISAGNSYTANSNAATIAGGQAGVVGLSGNACDGFATLQQRNNNNKIDPCLNWSANMLDRANAVGVGLRKAFGSLDVNGMAIYSHARWDNSVSGGNWGNNPLNGPGAAPTTVAAYFIPATPLPTVSTDNGELRLIGTYALDKLQSVRISYDYMRMRSNDFAYEGMQFGSLSSSLPTNEQPFSYSVSVIGISYVLNF